eukprot:7119860-Alexandrium_andersonii.AAC.1
MAGVPDPSAWNGSEGHPRRARRTRSAPSIRRAAVRALCRPLSRRPNRRPAPEVLTGNTGAHSAPLQ